MKIVLQKASENELLTIVEILDTGTRNKIRRGDLAWGMSNHNPEEIKAMISQGLCYVAYLGDRPIGTCVIAWQDNGMWGIQPPDAGYLERFAIAYGYNGQDFGGQILTLAAEKVQQAGRQFLRLALPSDNMKLRAYYENHGFMRADQKVHGAIHPSYAAAYYEKSVV